MNTQGYILLLFSEECHFNKKYSSDAIEIRVFRDFVRCVILVWTMYCCDYYSFWHYPSSRLLFETRRFGDWNLSTSILLGESKKIPAKDGDWI
jgi:hypothetical protein